VIAPQPASPHPLGATLPGLYQDDALAQRLCAALDAVLAPDITMLDCFPAYLDPGTAPPDLLDWMAGWVGLDAVRDLPLERRRDLVRRAAQLHAWRGTPAAIRELVEIAAGLPVELDESGAAGWSVDAGSPLPGRDRPDVVVRIRTGATDLEPAAVELLSQLLALVMPAHLPWRLDLAP
jgi:phage tail-like protein